MNMETNQTQLEIIAALKEYLEADNDLRRNPISWRSSLPHSSDPHWSSYTREKDRYQAAVSNLWLLTDVEYDNDGFRNVVWNWRYWSVMARKCCWYQKDPLTYHKAGETMHELQQAETKFAEVCGLMNQYKPASFYIEEQFPNLKS